MQQQITIELIENKDFKYKTRGYDPEEVDIFLDAVCDEMSHQLDTIAELQQKLDAMNAVRPAQEPKREAEPVMAAPAQETAKTTESVQEVLTAAVRFKEQIEKDARIKADSVIADAEERAAAMLSQAEAKVNDRLKLLNEEHDRLSEQVESLRKAAQEYREEFTQLLKKQQQALEEATELF